MSSFDGMWSELAPVGRSKVSGGYRRYAWTREDAELREWFAGACSDRGLDVEDDRAGNQWAWWGDPDAAVARGDAGVVVGSHLDSVPDGGAFDGPLGVVSALAAVDRLRADGVEPSRPVGIVAFGDEEGARFGVACAGSRIVTGALSPQRALALVDGNGTTMGEAMAAAGRETAHLGRDDRALARVGAFVELHVEQGYGLAGLRRPVAVGTSIWPHGRWRFDLVGRADHAGTTRLADRADPMLSLAVVVQRVRELAERHGVLATCGKVVVRPNAVNAIPSSVTGWLDARGDDAEAVRRLVAEMADAVAELGGEFSEESWTAATSFDASLADRVAAAVGAAVAGGMPGLPALPGLKGDVPRLATGAGHDAGILATAGIPTAMLFVRNPTGVSHSPEEFAEPADCAAGVSALADVVTDLACGPARGPGAVSR